MSYNWVLLNIFSFIEIVQWIALFCCNPTEQEDDEYNSLLETAKSLENELHREVEEVEELKRYKALLQEEPNSGENSIR